MTVRNLDRVFEPKSVAVVGASETPGKVGRTVLENLLAGGFASSLYPVNSKRDDILGRKTWRSIGDLPETPDLAVVCTPASTVPEVVAQCGSKGVPGLVIVTAGFREVGPAGKALEDRVRAEQRRWPGMRIIGPNCLGVIAPHSRLNASFAAGAPPVGDIAFLSQSGALCTAVLDWAITTGVGFSCFVSLGNKLDVGFGSLLDYLAEDPRTKSAILYVESIHDARVFLSAARAFSREKPLVAYKAGRFPASAQAAASHTGALAGVDDVYQAAFDRTGVVRVDALQSVFECVEILASRVGAVGKRTAIVTNAGGPGVMAADALLARRGELASLSPRTLAELDKIAPPNWSHGDPIDVLGDAGPERFAAAVEIALADPQVDNVLTLLTPQAMTNPTDTARRVGEVARRRRFPAKPLLASWMGGASMNAGREALAEANVPTFDTPEQAIAGLSYLAAHARSKETLYETPRNVRLTFGAGRDTARERVARLARELPKRTLTEIESKQLLVDYGIPTTPILAATTADEAVAAARSVGWPVAAKILSPEITHKTDVGGVALNLANDEQVREAFERMTASARRSRPDATIQGVTIQRMAGSPHGVEILVGAKRDPVFGPVLLVGLGGIAAELADDNALELPPIDERMARRMLERLRMWPLLEGYRGRPGVDVESLVETILRFSQMLVDLPDVAEADLNPVVVSSSGAIALDARFVVDPVVDLPNRPYAHLAIRPWPEEFVSTATTSGGLTTTIRPIRAADEPAWKALLATCSTETIRSRFRHLFKEATHEMAARFCFLDYHRELALVAEQVVPGLESGPLLGVVRLMADADHETAEFALLVADPWQGQGVGRALAERGVAVAREWGVKKLVGETTPDNSRMLKVFRRNGFTLTPDEDVLRAELPLA